MEAAGGLVKLCGCHGEPMLWNKDPRYSAGGYWKCGVRHREGERRRYASNPQPKRDQVSTHYLIRGWKVKRLRYLGQQREQVIRKLEGTDA